MQFKIFYIYVVVNKRPNYSLPSPIYAPLRITIYDEILSDQASVEGTINTFICWLMNIFYKMFLSDLYIDAR